MDGTDRLLADIRMSSDTLDFLDDRGLEHAEALIHELRYRRDLTSQPDPRIARALDALSGVRTLTKRAP